jgi:alpha-mannosidase
MVSSSNGHSTSKLLLKVSLTAGKRMLDFAVKVDWNESEKMLRASFPVDIYTEQVNFYLSLTA